MTRYTLKAGDNNLHHRHPYVFLRKIDDSYAIAPNASQLCHYHCDVSLKCIRSHGWATLKIQSMTVINDLD
jgi:hypothetical protein